LVANASHAIQASRRSWLGVVSVMTGIFVIVTAEILPIGLLLPIASTFAISEGTAGLTMTLPGFVAAVAAPVMTVWTAGMDRRVMLCVWMAVLATSNFICALADHYWLILVARVMVGLVIGGFWSIGAGLGGRLVSERHVQQATSVIFVAVPLGSVLGVPAGTFIAGAMGWRSAFAVLGVLTLAVFVALLTLLPALPAVHVTRLGVMRSLLRQHNVRIGLLATFLIVLAHFGAYTYVTPLLEQVTRIGLALIGSLLLVYGAAGIVGNFAVGFTMHRWLPQSFGGAAFLIGFATLLLPAVGQWVWATALLLVVWGVAYGAVPACSQTWLARSAPDATEAATVLFTSAFQATIGIGALVGGVVVDTTSVPTVMVCGGIVAALAALVIVGAGPATR
jgi:predicted MFS family arabinose efflux permease